MHSLSIISKQKLYCVSRHKMQITEKAPMTQQKKNIVYMNDFPYNMHAAQHSVNQELEMYLSKAGHILSE